ncbi:very short patch repair endonuclease [Candidatus Woesearchaeota archaeon]|nr:very short patch repair endonuclease [Candidatus Woesearchaeota archaeon]
MTDTFTQKQRSYIMSRIKAANTAPELFLRKLLRSKGIRYRLHYKLIGKPDVVVASKKLAIFIDGCFWHGCRKCLRLPRTNKPYWIAKIKRNVNRAKIVNKKLKSEGWKVMRIWEHELKQSATPSVKKVEKFFEK